MSKFTQQQLEEAFAQMQEERLQDRRNAEQAAKWVKQQLGFGHCNYSQPYGYGYLGVGYGPHPVNYVLTLSYGPYGPDIQDFTNALAEVTWVTDGPAIPGFGRGPFYVATTPHGTYGLTFAYADC